jgi:GT2 family glycosyltransferase
VTNLPDEVRTLLADRAAARAERDWQRADALRDQLHALGWEPQDGVRGSTARPILPSRSADADAGRDEALGSLLGEPASVDASLQLLAEDHPDDLARFLRGFAAHRPQATFEIVVVANAPGFDVGLLLAGSDVTATVLRVAQRLGWADARNLGLRRSRGEVTVLLDTSLEPIGDFLSPLLAAFDNERVGIAGGWGVTSDDGRQFDEAPPGEVDAIEAYCLALRRAALRDVEGFDHRFRFYRNADLDLSFAVRDHGWRAVRTAALPLERHEHRGYAALPAEERERLSRRNFYRFLKHWGDRRDLLLSAAEDVGRGARIR